MLLVTITATNRRLISVGPGEQHETCPAKARRRLVDIAVAWGSIDIV